MKLGEIVKVARGDWYIIPKYNRWVTKGRNLEAERDTLVGIMTRPPRVRTATFSASGAGRCLRERQLAFLGLPQAPNSEKTMNIFANGDYVHLRHQVAGLMEGYLQAAEVPVLNVTYNLTGTMDGKLDNGGLAEYKSINSRGFAGVCSYGPKNEHLGQVSSYLLAGDLDFAQILYENKDTQELKEFRVGRDEKRIAEVVQELEQLNEATDSRRLLPMLTECQEKRGRYRSCPYREVCLEARFESPERRIRLQSSTSSD